MARPRLLPVHLLGIVLLAAAPAAAQQSPAPAGGATGKGEKPTAVKFIEFDHLNTDGDRAYVLKLNDGEPFQVRILNTCATAFTYEVQGILRQDPPAPGTLGLNAGEALGPKTLPVIHEERYGGYLVSIKRLNPNTLPCGVDSPNLVTRTLIISAPKMTWDLAFSGGFTLSNLASPHYYLRPDPTQAGKSIVQEDPSKNDDANLGIATWVHVYHHRLPSLAGTFGLGIRDSNKTEYYLGGGLRMSDKASINGGVVFGPVSRLKDGINIGDSVTDPNVLNDLPTMTKRGFFIGLSYSFIDVRGKLQQPFAGATGASGNTGTTGTGNATAAPAAPAPAAPATPATPAAPAAAQPATPPATPQPQAGACTVTFANESVTIGKEIGDKIEVAFTVAPAGCAWRIEAGVPAWANPVPLNGTGNGTITLTATAPNTFGTVRRETMRVSGKNLQITQAQ
jgi:hypothetical protein